MGCSGTCFPRLQFTLTVKSTNLHHTHFWHSFCTPVSQQHEKETHLIRGSKSACSALHKKWTRQNIFTLAPSRCGCFASADRHRCVFITQVDYKLLNILASSRIHIGFWLLTCIIMVIIITGKRRFWMIALLLTHNCSQIIDCVRSTVVPLSDSDTLRSMKAKLRF